jgi:hypothetical protein
MELWQTGLIGAIAGTLAVLSLQRKAKTGGKERVLPLLRERGRLTIPEIMEALGENGLSAQGKVAMEVRSLVQSGQVSELPVPDGTPQLQKIKVRKYAVK